MESFCNNNLKPLIFLGSSHNMTRFVDLCCILNIEVAGIIDNDYWGNTANLANIPIIDTEQSFQDLEKLKYYSNEFNFFCASSWTPEPNPVDIRNREKRSLLIKLLDEYKLPVISLVDPWSRISPSAVIGKGVFIDAFTIIETDCVISDYATVYAHSGIGHHTQLGWNSVIQRYCSIAGECKFEANTYVGTAVRALKPGAVFGEGSFIHEAVYIRRGTIPNEVVGMNGKNMSRVKVL